MLYVAGAMAIVGSIRDGAAGDPTVLYVKALLDGTASVVLGSTLGLGVAFSAISVLIYQGTLTLAAGWLSFLNTPPVINAVSGTGGLMILGIGLNVLNLTHIKIGNLIPAIFFAILAGLWL